MCLIVGSSLFKKLFTLPADAVRKLNSVDSVFLPLFGSDWRINASNKMFGPENGHSLSGSLSAKLTLVKVGQYPGECGYVPHRLMRVFSDSVWEFSPG